MANKSPLQSRYLPWILVTLVLVAVSLAGCVQPTSILTPDTTPPSAITGLGATDAYDGRVNLWWDMSTAEDFDHYNIYVGESAIVDVSSMTPVQQIKDIATNTFQATGLKPGTKYYFAVTAVDQSSNEKNQVIGASAISLPTPDTTPPSAITGLGATDAYDGRVNLWWDMSTAEDFDHYNIYVGESAIVDVSMTPVQQIKDIATNTFQATGLKPGTKYYFAVTAVDQSSNEKNQVTCVSAIPTKHVTLDVPTLVSVPDEAITRKFIWKYGGIDWDWEAKISKQLYQTLHDKPRVRLRYAKYSVYVTHSLDDVFFQKLAVALSTEAGKLGFTEHQMVELAVLFVQTIPYTKDIDSTGLQEYPRYPIETLVEGTGDCEDHAILLAELLRSMNYDAILLEYRDEHMAVGVADPGNTYGYHYIFNGKSYYYVETTATGWEIGEAPDEFRQLAYMWDLVPTPALYCEQYRWPAFRGTMPLELTICNDGTAPALGATVYAFLDAGNNKCYADASTTIDIAPEETRTVTLMLKLPGHPVQTRVGYRIFYNDSKVDEGFSDWFDYS